MIMRKCPVCETVFEPRRVNMVFCTKDCARKATRNRTRAQRVANHEVMFVGLDGEGVTLDNGDHHYALLSVGSHSMHRGGQPLDHHDVLEFLWREFLDTPNAVFVGFYLGYDFTQWFKTLSEERARMLFTEEGRKKRAPKHEKRVMPFPVDIGGFQVDMLGMKRFRLRKIGEGEKRWMYVCDVGAFFQCSFLKAIDPSQWTEPIVTDDEYETLARGKAQRSTAQFDRDMIRYNILENDVLARLMDRMNTGLTVAKLRLKRSQWFGPGQAAQEWLNQTDAPTAAQVKETVPREIVDMARRSYYGGWFELFHHGIVPGMSYEYDINSAYPDVISRLPCLLHGKWNIDDPNSVNTDKSLSLIDVTLEGSNQWSGTMPYRTSTGRILRPQRVRGIYWLHEIVAAMRAGLVDTWNFHRVVTYTPCKCPSPLRDIRALYLQRLGVGKKSPQGRAYRLVYNSAYGKFAQSIGHPKYGNAIYASLITAGCRTRILDAIATHPQGTRDLLMVATDGVYFRTPHIGLELDDSTLGAWSGSTKKNLSLFMPGMYWDDKTREQVSVGQIPVLKSRGVNGRDLSKFIDWIDGEWQTLGMVGRIPSVEIDVAFSMVSLNQALARGKWETAGRIEHDKKRVLSADWTQKRQADWWQDADALYRTVPYFEGPSGLESTPYSRAFGDELQERLTVEECQTPDGDWNDLLWEGLSK